MNAIIELNEQKYKVFLSRISNDKDSNLFFLTFYTEEKINKDNFVKQEVNVLYLDSEWSQKFYIIASFYDEKNYKYILIGEEKNYG